MGDVALYILEPYKPEYEVDLVFFDTCLVEAGNLAVSAPTILLVESDILARNPLAEYLHECGYQVSVVTTSRHRRFRWRSPWRAPLF